MNVVLPHCVYLFSVVFCLGLSVEMSDAVDEIAKLSRAIYVQCADGYITDEGESGFWVLCQADNVWAGLMSCDRELIYHNM